MVNNLALRSEQHKHCAADTARYVALRVNALLSRFASIGVHSNVGYHGLTMLCACTYFSILKISVLHHCQMTIRWSIVPDVASNCRALNNTHNF